MPNYITTREEIAEIVSSNGQNSFAKMLLDLGFDPDRPVKVEYNNGKVEYWQPDDSRIIIPQNHVINGSQRQNLTRDIRYGKKVILKNGVQS